MIKEGVNGSGNGVLFRRVGDILQALAVMAIVGLAGITVSLSVTVARQDTKIDGMQNAIKLQLDLLKDVTAHMYSADQGKRLQEDEAYNRAEFRAHEQLEGHPKMVARVAAIDARLIADAIAIDRLNQRIADLSRRIEHNELRDDREHEHKAENRSNKKDQEG